MFTTAQRLAELDAQMRRPHAARMATEARFRFYETAVRQVAIRRLNSLGEMVPRSRLSERSLDLIFEDDRYVAGVLKRIVSLADADPDFRRLLVAQEGETALAYWRSRVPRDLFGQAMAA